MRRINMEQRYVITERGRALLDEDLRDGGAELDASTRIILCGLATSEDPPTAADIIEDFLDLPIGSPEVAVLRLRLGQLLLEGAVAPTP
jgi:hypothetical protein